MGKNFNIESFAKIGKKVSIFCEILVIFLILGSSIAIIETGFSEQNKSSDVQNEVLNQGASSEKPGLAPENPDFVEYQQTKKLLLTGSLLNGHRTDFIPAPVDLSHLSQVSIAKVSYPTSCDLRALNKVTPVKNQGNAGSCWAFATYASLESYSLPDQTCDFSENNLKNLLSNVAPQGFDFPEGGNEYMSTAYLARWSGAVNESSDPYSDSSVYSSTKLGLPIQKHIQDVIILPNRQGSLDNDEIKSALQNYGVLYTSMYYGPTYDNLTTHSYYYTGSALSNHAVAIVGWDDNYAKTKFTRVPPGNGAFIVKNSWGTGYGANGYFYVSYYDSNIGRDNTVFTDEETSNYKNIYQYDPLGSTAEYGFHNSVGWGANVFTAKSSEVLKAVSFYTTDSNCGYNIFIYTNPNSGPINQTGPVITQSGTSSEAGYHTVHLNTEIPLNSGQKFSVVIKLTNPNWYYPVALEMPLSGYSTKAKANSSESYISSDGTRWSDMTSVISNTNICIKAFTDAGKVVSSNNNLSSLTISSGTLSPAFASGTTAYKDSVSYSVSSVTVTPTAANSTATITVNGNSETSGRASQTINLNAGTNSINVVVTAQSGTNKTYTINVTRAAPPSNNNLSSLTISSGTLSPAFASGTTAYNDSVPYSVSNVTVTPRTAESTATITVNGNPVTSGRASRTINLNAGTNSINVVVTAQSGTNKTYTITVTRAAPSSNNNLSSLTIKSGTLSPAFASGTTAYTDNVSKSVSSVTVTPTVANSTATIKVNGIAVTSGRASQTINLNAGTNSINVVVTAQSGTTKTYTITVTRAVTVTRAAPSSNNNLTSLTIKSGTLSPAFASGTTTYKDSVSHSVSSVTVTPTTAESTATIKVNGIAVTSGRTSQTINLNTGTNSIKVAVTAQSGTTRTYTIAVTRS